MTDGGTTPLSVAIVAKDEADRIAACIDSVSFADEVVVVVDASSRDETLAIAQSRGCRAISQDWLGFARQKQFAVDACRHDWVLVLDADERIPDETATAIHRVVTLPDNDACAFSLLRKNIFHGRWIRHCGWWPDRVTRLVDRRRGRFSDHLVHEHWMADGTVAETDFVMAHHSFRSYADLIDKLQTYSTLAARQMLAEDRRATVMTPLSHGAWMFLRTYLLELGVLDGFDGFMIAALNAGGSFMKYAKLLELQRWGADAAPDPPPSPDGD